MVELRQGAGDALFVPSGWHHTVENTEGRLDSAFPFLSVPTCSYLFLSVRSSLAGHVTKSKTHGRKGCHE